MGESEYLTLDQILQADDLAEQDLDVPEWGGRIRIRALSAAQSTELVTRSRRKDGSLDTQQAMFATLQLGIIKPTIDATVYEALMRKGSAPVLRITKAIQDLSGMSLSDEDLAKNSPPALS